MIGIVHPPRSEEFPQHREAAGNHRTRHCSRKDQAAAPNGILQRKLLRQSSAPGDAKRVDLSIAKVVEETRREIRHRPETVWTQGRRGFPSAGNIERNRFYVRQSGGEWRKSLETCPDAVEQQQRGAPPYSLPNAHAQPLVPDLYRPNFDRPGPVSGRLRLVDGLGQDDIKRFRGHKRQARCPSADDSRCPTKTAQEQVCPIVHQARQCNDPTKSRRAS